MADKYQYVKLPDGSYGKFSATATDADIHAFVVKDFPNAYPNTKPSAAPPATFGDVATGRRQATDMPLTGGLMAPTERGVANVMGGVSKAVTGAYDAVRHPINTLMGMGQIPGQVAQIPGAIRDIAQSQDPVGYAANVAENTAGEGAGQALMAAATEGLRRIPYSRIQPIAGAKAIAADIPIVRKLGAFIKPEPGTSFPKMTPGEATQGAAMEADKRFNARAAAKESPVGETVAEKKSGVTRLPEPTKELPGGKGAAFSMKRPTALMQAGKQGYEGPGDVMKLAGKNVLYEPAEGTGYEGPKEKMSFTDRRTDTGNSPTGAERRGATLIQDPLELDRQAKAPGTHRMGPFTAKDMETIMHDPNLPKPPGAPPLEEEEK